MCCFQVEQALSKVSCLEKAKYRIQCEMEDLLAENERANSSSAALDKKQKQFDRMVAEWKSKCEGVAAELEASQKETRLFSAEVYRLKAAFQESQDGVEALRRENKSLSDEVRDLVDQLSTGGRGLHELEKAVKRAEQERAEMQHALEDMEAALERETAKAGFAALEAATARQEIEKRVAEKDEEFENTRQVDLMRKRKKLVFVIRVF